MFDTPFTVKSRKPINDRKRPNQEIPSKTIKNFALKKSNKIILSSSKIYLEDSKKTGLQEFHLLKDEEIFPMMYK